MANTQDKRNANGSGTVRKRSDGMWEARCTINGKRQSFYADKQSEALKKMRAAQKDADDGTYLEPSKLTVNQWLDIWLEEYARNNIKISTYYSYRGYIRNHFYHSIGDITLQKLTPTHIQTLYNTLLRVKELNPITISHINTVLNQALDQALKLRYINSNPVSLCTLPRKKKKEISPLTENEIVSFLEAIKESRYEKMFMTALFTGMREGEICGLPWSAVNFKKGTITISQQLSVDKINHRIFINTTKNGKERIITPAPFVMKLLRDRHQEQLSQALRMGIAWRNEWNLVFTKPNGEYIHPSTVYYQFKKVVARIGCPHARFHDLRHTYAVTALQEGDSPKTVQENLGHATANFTMNVYAHVSEKMKQDSADRMQAYYQKLKA